MGETWLRANHVLMAAAAIGVRETMERLEPQLLVPMLDQLVDHCRFAGIAGAELADACKRVLEAHDNERPDPESQLHLWFFCNAFLGSAATVSRYLWPSPNRRRELRDAFPHRGSELRELLGVVEDSPLNSRAVRNHFEHIDERLEEWWLSKNRKHGIVTKAIQSVEARWYEVTEDGSGGGNLDAITIYERFDPQRVAIAFLDDVVELEPIMTALNRLLANALRAIDGARAAGLLAAAEGALARRHR